MWERTATGSEYLPFLNALRGHSVFRKQDEDRPFCLIIVQQLAVSVKTIKCNILNTTATEANCRKCAQNGPNCQKR